MRSLPVSITTPCLAFSTSIWMIPERVLRIGSHYCLILANMIFSLSVACSSTRKTKGVFEKPIRISVIAGQSVIRFTDISRFLSTIAVSGLACVVDRPGYDARYRDKYGRRLWHLCQTAFSIVVERAAKFALANLWPMAIAGYDQGNRAHVLLKSAGRLIESRVPEAQWPELATKYSCFELVRRHARGS
jgi:hypothetical protein